MSLLADADTGAPGPPANEDFPARFGVALDRFLRTRPDVEAARDLAGEVCALVLAGGKRLRPAFAWWGWRAAGGAASGDAAEATVRALVSLELLQCCALVHDDVMDRSATRRGRQAVHEVFAARHRRHRWSGSARHHGDCAAILVGDLALAWADDALVTAGLPAAALRRAWGPWQEMRTEMMAGQHLDLLATARRDGSMEGALRVAALKTAAYTVERPLHLGAALAGAPADVVECLRAFGRDVGVAFQLRDDLIGVFGDGEVTGKPVGGDLREGKRTPLMAIAMARATAAGDHAAQRVLRQCFTGVPVTDEAVAAVRALLVGLGAVEAVERHIDALTASGLAALDRADVDEVARENLERLAARAVHRRD
ncbi:polyprenyl synthetase family protein [Saccharothrix sp. S26]|uniref:polyprenyl synthetase family protein n=1 Tax=Saccharothrix sp. S26 TaxID=2907215 RepID=UPI001F374FFE|nr:polyprenyl synthetase family protein [Saccharothrix sp. S26]MCE7000947.1 polyprenyl synthetase family protein [Saccharothrix sp. S26]